MTTTSADRFLDRLRISRIVPEETLEAFLRGHDGLGGDDLRDALIEARLLTTWQARKLGEGRVRGFVLGKYLILEPLGTGGMGSVYKARHTRLGNDVALKVVARRALKRSNALARFDREARVASQLQHPNIVRTFDYDGLDEAAYLVMELMKGESLERVVQRKGPLDFPEAVEYLRQAALGLAYAHEHGCIHRDVKPSNLMKDHLGVIKVLDFGLARIEDDDSSLTIHDDTKLLGTVDYVAPEQAIDSSKVDGRADIYGLGCTFYFLLVGHAPFREGTPMERLLKHKLEEPTSLKELRLDIPPEVYRLWKKMTRKKPDDRYASADLIAEDCAKYLSQFPPEQLVFPGDPDEAPAPVERIRGGSLDTRRRPVPMDQTKADESIETDAERTARKSDAAVASQLAEGEERLGLDLASVEMSGSGATVDGVIGAKPGENWADILAATSQSVAMPAPKFANGTASAPKPRPARPIPTQSPAATQVAALNTVAAKATPAKVAPTPATVPHDVHAGPAFPSYSVLISISAGLLLGGAIVAVVIAYALSTAP
ncbi:MAG TPA: protein kinase [Pirellulaceae bacterium]|jgi:serine/threonine protein kinase|nr:protein kinase [Pirellulaceae bacterium]